MDFNEESTDPFSSSETGGWNYNPLFDNNNIVDENHHMQLPFRNKHGGVNNCDSKRTELALGEYETESGYSESLSFLSDILSAENFFDNSFDSSSLDNFSTFSDIEEELERIAELADGMRGKGRLSISSGHDRESVVSPANSSQIVSSKGTIRGVKNRVRDNIFHFLSEQNQQQRKKEEEEQDEEVGSSESYHLFA